LPPENAAIAIPFSDRRDKIGALARSIGIFQTAMRKNVELNRTVLNDADLRSQRQQDMANEISHFSSEVEATLAELGRISDEISPHRRSSEAQPTMHRQ
jgi:methyl-accepting chemotaxis protein